MLSWWLSWLSVGEVLHSPTPAGWRARFGSLETAWEESFSLCKVNKTWHSQYLYFFLMGSEFIKFYTMLDFKMLENGKNYYQKQTKATRRKSHSETRNSVLLIHYLIEIKLNWTMITYFSFFATSEQGITVLLCCISFKRYRCSVRA